MILCIAPVDNGGQLYHLCEALNRYTKYDARCLTFKQTYLQYETDLLLSDFDTLAKWYELRDLARSADFFIFSEFLPTDPKIKHILQDLGILTNITPKNTIIRVAGSYSRANAEHYLLEWIKHDWIYAGPYSDWTLSGSIGRIIHVNYICPVDKIPEPKPTEDTIRICFAPTRVTKGIDDFISVMQRLENKHENVEPVVITKKPWREAISIKATCHITFDQFMMTHYANNGIESMYLKHAVLSKISSLCYAYYHDLPIQAVRDKEELQKGLENLIENPELIRERGEAGRKYVMKYHHPEVVAKQWEKLIEHVLRKD